MKAKNILTVCAFCILASCANSSKDKQTLNDNDSLSVVNSSIDVNSLTIDEISKSEEKLIKTSFVLSGILSGASSHRSWFDKFFGEPQ